MSRLAASCAAILPAGGSGSRFGGAVPKQFLPVAGRPLIAWSIDRFARSGLVDRIVVAVAPDERARLEAIARDGGWRIEIAEGGAARQDSVWNALQRARDAELVAVHDAVRPLFSIELLASLLDAARADGAAIPALPLTDTVHRVSGGLVADSPGREELVGAQTPQCFRSTLLVEALERARAEGFSGTDEASVVRRYGHRVRVLPGEPSNIKVTRPEDLERVAAALARE